MGRWRARNHEGQSVFDSESMSCADVRQPDITFFGQALSLDFDRCLLEDRDKVDLLVIIGTSLKVAPVSEVLSQFCNLVHKRG